MKKTQILVILFKIPLAIKKELRVKTVASYLLIYRPKTLQSNTLNVCDGEFRKNDKQLKLLHIFAENLCSGCSTQSLNTSLEPY